MRPNPTVAVPNDWVCERWFSDPENGSSGAAICYFRRRRCASPEIAGGSGTTLPGESARTID
jgi:hypothetical protein